MNFFLGQSRGLLATFQNPGNRIVTTLFTLRPLNGLAHQLSDDSALILTAEGNVKSFLYVIGDAEINSSHSRAPLIVEDFNNSMIQAKRRGQEAENR
jgi:hypothetical protein